MNPRLVDAEEGVVHVTVTVAKKVDDATLNKVSSAVREQVRWPSFLFLFDTFSFFYVHTFACEFFFRPCIL
jgi:hypothetical protein